MELLWNRGPAIIGLSEGEPATKTTEQRDPTHTFMLQKNSFMYYGTVTQVYFLESRLKKFRCVLYPPTMSMDFKR